ncbi:hypothetical protein TPHA_0H02860 [Tetrapisispora phaffii CBS 4417]|uniref:Uncharacterized protein n=1 Tax=Tetrapisispora phaffii (strain ATCC 24235 / CBS 4417 / NBRC 1672 / NRRL Y-8282 / UCD 70-5) TaxID=1071381 RepID=G8BWN8_TETPH|nr:hypothetical protein TPHA_0H02860 [Tetrapisispora phaffii CBS 4417]CCE64489.1 hypothetical protein TPHA_0H02860 [Tetrapisispora phaffii CBS 4417]
MTPKKECGHMFSFLFFSFFCPFPLEDYGCSRGFRKRKTMTNPKMELATRRDSIRRATGRGVILFIIRREQMDREGNRAILDVCFMYSTPNCPVVEIIQFGTKRTEAAEPHSLIERRARNIDCYMMYLWRSLTPTVLPSVAEGEGGVLSWRRSR